MPDRIAPLDRRVTILQPTLGAGTPSTCLVSELRDRARLVLLGEPGIGKSEVLRQEARALGTQSHPVQAFRASPDQDPTGTLFLDGLDEFRADGAAGDKIHALAAAIGRSGATRWRLTCRTEDWREAADRTALETTPGAGEIVVARLEPLDRDEAASVLAALGEADPEGFLDGAGRAGAAPFTENPLSLRLLREAVVDGAWPETRFELLDTAIGRLVREHNRARAYAVRPGPAEIRRAAGRACLTMLLAGAPGIWRPAAPPPAGGDLRAPIEREDLGLEPALFDAVLDTALFRGGGAHFEPMHRVVAEFLGAEALAAAVAGGAEAAALPLARATALLAAPDGRPPSELRGLFAWLAAHLARIGREDDARQLIACDPTTCLVYGDAAVLGPEGRRALLDRLGVEDPYFLSDADATTALGGLAGEDLAAEFRRILATPDETHRLATVFQALATGRPVQPLRPDLRAIVLDPARPDWHRRRALEAWLNGAGDRQAACREIFAALRSEAPSLPREILRIDLATDLAGALPAADLRAVIAGYDRHKNDRGLQLYGLKRRLEAAPRPELFDAPLFPDEDPRRPRRRSVEVEHFVDDVLAATIRAAPPDGAQLCQWLAHAGLPTHPGPSQDTRSALEAWLDTAPRRDVALFRAMLANDPDPDSPWMVLHRYTGLTRRAPSDAILADLLEAAATTADPAEAVRLLAVAVEIAGGPATNPALYWAVFEAIHGLGDESPLRTRLTECPVEAWRLENAREEIEDRARRDTERDATIAALSPLLADLRAGQRCDILDRAAADYLARPSGEPDAHTGLARVLHRSNDAIAAAIAEGWLSVIATADRGRLDPAALGQNIAVPRVLPAGPSLVAGLDLLLDQRAQAEMARLPLIAAIAALEAHWLCEEEERRRRLEAWAIGHLARDSVIGAAALAEIWTIATTAIFAQESPDRHIRSLWRIGQADVPDALAAPAFERLLSDRPALLGPLLHEALRGAGQHMARARLLKLADAALAEGAVAGEARRLWAMLAFLLDPLGHPDPFAPTDSGNEIADAISGATGTTLLKRLADLDAEAALARDAALVRRLGPHADPDFWPSAGPASMEFARGQTLRRALDRMVASDLDGAADALRDLTDAPSLVAWRVQLRHALAEHLRLARDRAFRHPEPHVIRAALSGGPPANARDLRAVVTEELDRLAREMHGTDVALWQAFWNLDPHERVTGPCPENACRSRLLTILRPRLERYRIAAAIPEAQQAGGTRADMLILSGTGRTLPIEVKRHMHPKLWTAASGQLQTYANTEGADGFGVYLVFWFGADWAQQVPARPVGGPRPQTAAELAEMLRADLPEALRQTTDVVVLDAAQPRT